MKKLYILSSIDIEVKRRIIGRSQVDPHADVLWKKSLTLINDNTEKEKLLNAYKFAQNIKYDHAGLSSEVYFAHPVRVASLAMLKNDKVNIDLGILGLLHNVNELSEHSNLFIEKKFGKKISNMINILTVNRDIQWDLDYKDSYYEKIDNGPLESRIIKVFDKLDNLFVLDLNPDKKIKTQYLNEIIKHVLPMAEKNTPYVYHYMKELVDYNLKKK